MTLSALLALTLTLLANPTPQEAGPATRRDSELARLPFRPEMNLILLDLRIGDSEPLTFVLDSGASSAVLERSVAERLGLRTGPERRRKQTSVRAELTYSVAASVPIRLGEYEFELPNIIVTSVQGTAQMMLGRTAHGILGHGFLSRHTVEIDYERGELVVHDPKTYRYEGEGTALQLVFDPKVANLPFTPVTIETTSGTERQLNMLVDSAGSVMGTLGLHDRAVLDVVVPDDAARVPFLGATGLGDSTEATMHTTFVTRLHRVRIGPFAIERPTATCDPDSSPRIDLFGAEVLHRFHVVFDYERSRMILEPNTAFSKPARFDCSGMMLVASEEDTSLRRIVFVSPDSPAAEAGLQRGDVILEIDDRAADAQSLHATRELFYELEEFRLKLQRGEQTFTATLRTHDLLSSR